MSLAETALISHIYTRDISKVLSSAPFRASVSLSCTLNICDANYSEFHNSALFA